MFRYIAKSKEVGPVETLTILDDTFLVTRQADLPKLRVLVFKFYVRWKVPINLEKYDAEGNINGNEALEAKWKGVKISLVNDEYSLDKSKADKYAGAAEALARKNWATRKEAQSVHWQLTHAGVASPTGFAHLFNIRKALGSDQPRVPVSIAMKLDLLIWARALRKGLRAPAFIMRSPKRPVCRIVTDASTLFGGIYQTRCIEPTSEGIELSVKMK